MIDQSCVVCGCTDLSARHDDSRPLQWVAPDLCTKCAEDVAPGEVIARVIQQLELVSHQIDGAVLAMRNRGDKRRETMVQAVRREIGQTIKKLRCHDAYIAFRQSQHETAEGTSA